MSLPADNNLLSVSKASSLLEISSDTLRRLDKKGQVTPKRGPNGERLYSADDISLLKQILKKPVGERSYGIRETANILQVSPQTIRRWEREGKIVTSRTPGGTRFFTLKDIQALQHLPKTVQVQAPTPTPQIPTPAPQISPPIPETPAPTQKPAEIALPVLPFSMPEYASLPEVPEKPTSQASSPEDSKPFVVKRRKNYVPYIIIVILILLLGSTVIYLGRQTFFKSAASNGIEANLPLATPPAINPVQQITNIISNAFKTGSVIFQGAGGQFAEDNSNLFWDATNAFLGIGTNIPKARLTVSGEVTGAPLVELIGDSSNNILSAISGGQKVFNIDHAGNTQIAGTISDINDSTLNVLKNLAVGGDLNVAGGDITSSNNLRIYSSESTTFGSSASPTTINGKDITISGANNVYFNSSILTNSIKLSNTATTLPNGNTGIVDAIVDAWNHGGGSGGTDEWSRAASVVYPVNITDNLAIGGVDNSAPFYVAASSGNITTAGNIVVNGNTTLGSAITDTITFNGRVAQNSGLIPEVAGTNDLGSALLPWNNVYAVSFYQNGNPVCDSSGTNCPSGSVNYWGQTGGSLYPINNTADVLIGATSTASAKFAFKNVLTGTPTASISGTTTGVATYLTGNGNLAVTNLSHLTIGGTGTGGVDFGSPITSGTWNGSTIAADYGGTGFSSYTIGDLLYADSTSTLAKLADIAAGNVLISGGVGVAPSWGKVDLGTQTTGNYVSTITGTANQITASSSTGSVTLSIPSDFRAPGTVNAVNGIYSGITAGTQRIDALGNLVNILNISASGYATISGSLALGSSSAAAGPGNLNMSGNLSVNKVITGTTIYQGVNQVCDAGGSIPGCGGISYWGETGGILYPNNNTVDVLIGATSTTSAKFAFTGVNSGTPTASISGTTLGVATYLTGNGNLAVTNLSHLTIGGAGTGGVDFGSPITSGTWNGGTIAANYGGTGFSSYSVGDILYADTTSTLARLNDVAAGNVLISGGVGVAPSWNKVTLGTETTGNYVATVAGTANQITASSSTGDVTLSIPSDFRAPGTVNAVNGIYTGAVAGTRRIDASGNLINIVDISASGYATISGSLALGSSSAVAGPGNLDMSGNLVVGGNITGAVLNGTTGVNTGLGAGTVRIDASGNLTSIGTTQINGVTYTWPGSATANYVLQSTGTGASSTLAWVDPSVAIASNIPWFQGDGILYPKNSSTDVLIGSSATTSAKFAFMNVATGTPTASISANSGSIATYLTGSGNLATTNGTDLILGGSTTGNITLNPSNGTGTVTLTGYGTGIIHSTSGVLSSSAVNLAGSDVTGLLPLSNGGTNADLSGVSTGGLIYMGASALTGTSALSGLLYGNGSSGPATVTGLTTNYLPKYSSSPYLTNSLVYDTGTQVGIGTTSPTALLDVAGNASVSGTLAFHSGTGTIQTTNFSNLVIGGSTTGNITLNPSNAVSGGNVSPATTGVTDLGTSSLLYRNIYGTALYQGTYQVCDSSGANCPAGSSLWSQSLGSLYPTNNTVNVYFGATAATATTSAKFAFTGINGGTPTASISGTLNVATFIDGNGNISSTNRNNLTLGNSSTYNTTGNILLNPNGTGNVGIGTTSPSTVLTLQGSNSVATLGSELLTTTNDRTFAGSGNWSGTNWTIGSGVATHTAAGTNNFINSALSAVAGNTYQIKADVNTTSPGNIYVQFGGTNSSPVGETYADIIQQTWVVTAVNTTSLRFVPNSSWKGTLDNVSVRQITPANAIATINNSDGSAGNEFRAGGSGLANTFVGLGAGQNNISGNNNSAFGYQALLNNTTGSYNVANGSDTLQYNTTGNSNIANGYHALFDNTTGGGNIANGTSALYYNTTGNSNIANGYFALYYNTTGSNNIANGTSALYYNTTGSSNVANGTNALQYNTTGNYNAANGEQTLFNNTTGNNNVANGPAALYYNTTGSYNVANGSYALFSNTIGSLNVANGTNALLDNTTGSYNVANGTNALLYNTTGSSNVANGSFALYYNTTGSSNVGYGTNTLYRNDTGSNNTALGDNSLNSIFSGSVTGTIDSFNYYGPGQVEAYVSAGHGLPPGTTLNVAINDNNGGDYYDGTYDVTYIDANDFYFSSSYYGGGNIVSFSDYSGTVPGTVLVSTSDNSLYPSSSSSVDISGTTNYSGTYLATYVDPTDFYIPAAFVGDDATGSWILDLPDTGTFSAPSITTPDNNTAVGAQSGSSLTLGNSNTFLGFSAGNNPSQKIDAVNSMALGNGAYTTADNQIVIGNSSVTQTVLQGNVGITGSLEVGSITNAAYSRLGTTATTHSLSSSADLLIGGKEELNGVLYLNNGQIADSLGTVTISFPTTPSAVNSYNNLGNGSWLVQNNVNPGIAALMVDQEKGGAIFTASVSGTPKFIINNSGNVGIGTTSPFDKLDVTAAGSGGVGGRIVITNSAADAVSNEADLGFKTSSSYTAGYYSSRIASLLPNWPTNNYGDLAFYNFNGGATSGTELMRIKSNGNVGIGTTAPNNKLSIVGVATTGDDALPALGANGGKFAVLNGGGSGAYGLLGGVLSTGNAFLQVQRVDTTATAYNMLLQPNGGNVGIGTTNPIGKLDISTSGTISPGGTWGNNILRIGKAGLSSGVGSDALGLGYDTTNEIGEIEAVSPGNSWRPIRMDASNFQLMGNVGIGRTPTANALEVNGTASKTASGSWLANSDRRIKTDIQDIPDALSTLESLRPVSFKYTDAYQKAENGVGDYTYYNFIAQEFQQVFPNNVQDSGETIDGNSHILQIDTYPVIPYLVKGIQEQQTEIATNSAQLANLSLDSDGNLNISQDNSGNYQLTNTSNGSVINQIAALGELVAGNIKAGLIQTTDFIAQNITAGAVTASTVVADNLTATSSTVQELAANSFTAFQGTIDHMLITSGLVAGNIQTKLISPLADETNVTVQVGSEATPSGQFVIQNASGSAVATIDNTGNATFSGTVSSNQLSVESNASISGTLYADNIKSRSLDDIQALLTQVQADQSLLSQASSWNIDTATNSANLSQLAVSDLYITNQAAIDSLSVTKTVTVGTDLVFSSTTDSQQSIVNSIDTLSAPLRIQSLAMAPVEIMNGLVTIDTKGNVQIAGDLYVAGRIHSSGLTLEPEPTGTDLVNGEATESAQLLTLQNNQGSIVASIDASGSAVFTNIQTQKITGSDEDRGSVEILPAEDSKIIQREWTSTPSAVLVSTSYKTQAWVTDTGENGFTVHVSDSPLDAPGKIYWWALW